MESHDASNKQLSECALLNYFENFTYHSETTIPFDLKPFQSITISLIILNKYCSQKHHASRFSDYDQLSAV